MSHPADTTQPRAPWLQEAIRRVLNLDKHLRLREGAQRHALQLLRAIEADNLPVPEVYPSRGIVMIRWAIGSRVLHLVIAGPDKYRVGRIQGGVYLPARTVSQSRVDTLRSLIAWLDPSVNTGFVDSYLK